MSLKNEKRYVYRTSLDFFQNICWLFILTYILSSCVFNPSVLLSKYIFQLLPHLCQKISVNSRYKLKVIVDPKIKQINFLDLPFNIFSNTIEINCSNFFPFQNLNAGQNELHIRICKVFQFISMYQ